MKNTKCCPKCKSQNIVRVPDDAHRYLANSICITLVAWVKRIPVARYVCCDCGYVENWVETQKERDEIRHTFNYKFNCLKSDSGLRQVPFSHK